MSRNFFSGIMRAARAAEREARAADRRRAIEARELLREQNQSYLESRIAEAEDQNETITEAVQNLQAILGTGLERDPCVMFETLYQTANLDDLPADLRHDPKPLGVLGKLMPGAKRRLEAHSALVEKRRVAMLELEAAATSHNELVDAFQANLQAGNSEAVSAYADLVLCLSPYPEGFHQEFRIGFLAESKQLVVDLRAPTIADIVPTVERFKYAKAQDSIVGSKKPERARQSLYSSAVAQLALRTLHELFSSDLAGHMESIVLNLYVVATDPATGHVVRPYIVSTRVAREEFLEFQLDAVDPQACLKRLKSSVSRSPAELVPVKPIVDINMADPRFIQ
jgi:restriction system protein